MRQARTTSGFAILLLVIGCCLSFSFLVRREGTTVEATRTPDYRRLQAGGNFFAIIWDLIAGLFTIGQANRCANPARCGLFGIFYSSYTGTPGTGSCQETCELLPPPADRCGVCGPAPPTISPKPAPSPTPVPGQFAITLDMALVPLFDRGSFIEAAARWENVITGDLSAVFPPGDAKPQYSGCSYPLLLPVDDIYVCARVAKGDGKGGTLAFAAPDYYRGGSRGLPWSGYINFDSDDYQGLKDGGYLKDIITHELGHILGIGAVWGKFGVTGSGNCPYVGVNANREYQALTGCSQIPTEQDGGGQTRCVHWDDTCLRDELMTGFINLNGANPLSRLTVAGLQDLGYVVDYSGADSFPASSVNSACRCNLRRSLATNIRQLSSPSSSTTTRAGTNQRRKLSEEMENYAISQGQAFLREQSQRVGAGARVDEGDETASIFVGDQFVSVWVIDTDGSIYSVDVWADTNS